MDREGRNALLRERASDYVQVALDGITTEYPVMPLFVATGPGPYRTHREMHPAFYGCFDWHSCVEMTWAIVRLLRRFPDNVPDERARAALNDLLTPEHIAAEVAFFSDPNHRSIERPYGWGWLLTLQNELRGWDDPDAAHWADAVQPLADLLAGNLTGWLPKLTYPQRTGVHPNTAFGLSRSYDFARWRADRGDDALLRAIGDAARRWFLGDLDYPAQYEPSGADFLSPALTEAELMSRLLPAREFSEWLDRFLPGIAAKQPATLFQPAIVSDVTDGQIAHLHGLNLSRGWAFLAIANRLPPGDARISPLHAAAERHMQASLPAVAGRGYMVEHWLAAYATLLLSDLSH
ncbi:MAG TPA: DUF2891 domain-containing protein [Thermomicrobiales bacterium]|nr:DUF2891 domain-containing protein [Thermomicrobiales bacterium]